MQLTFEQVSSFDGFDKLSDEAKELVKDYCEMNEIRFCDTCGCFLCGDFIWAKDEDYCSDECMEESGYSRKDLLQDYYDTPWEGCEGYDEMMQAKAELSADEFDKWLEERYDENDDAPVFWTEDQFSLSGEDKEAMQEVIWWLDEITIKPKELELAWKRRRWLFDYYGLPDTEPEDFDENDDYSGFLLDLWAIKDLDELAKELAGLEKDGFIEPYPDWEFEKRDNPEAKDFLDWFASKKHAITQEEGKD